MFINFVVGWTDENIFTPKISRITVYIRLAMQFIKIWKAMLQYLRTKFNIVTLKRVYHIIVTINNLTDYHEA